MALNFKTPGVYVQEIPVFPASIAGVATAVPVFIGYVEKAEDDGVGIPFFTPVRITSLLEYETHFGRAQGQDFSSIEINDNTSVTPTQRTITVVRNPAVSDFRLYYNLQMYFANGGGPCWVVPTGLYSSTIAMQDMLDGLAASAKADEPTLILFPDIFTLTSAEQNSVHNAALAQCELLKDRFVIMDVIHTGGNTVFEDSEDFRNDYVGIDSLKYGASYYPDLNTVLNYGINPHLLHVTSRKINGTTVANSGSVITFLNDIETAYQLSVDALTLARIAVAAKQALGVATAVGDADSAWGSAVTSGGALPAGPIATGYSGSVTATGNADTAAGLAVTAATAFVGTPSSPALGAALITSLENLVSISLTAVTTSYTNTSQASIQALNLQVGSLSLLSGGNPAVYNNIISQINSYSVTLNPSGAIAGIYARVDNERGVWKAPANVGIRSVIGPTINLTTAEQDGLNVDATSGKSINAIRSFTGKGTLVWGARTLAGNDNEWRYINVRRLFIYVEESVQEATEFVVFEANTANTWLRVRGMIEAFLTGLWRDGALAGATTKDAFFVRVGLGTTMTAQDILEGRMIVEIGMAAVRPAEFIILRFMHKLQES